MDKPIKKQTQKLLYDLGITQMEKGEIYEDGKDRLFFQIPVMNINLRLLKTLSHIYESGKISLWIADEWKDHYLDLEIEDPTILIEDYGEDFKVDLKERILEELVVEESEVEEREDLEYAKEDKYLEMEPEEFKFSRGDVLQYKENQGHGNIDRTNPRVVIKEHPDSEPEFRVVSIHHMTDSGYWTYGTIPQHKLEKVGEVERVPRQRETSSLEDLGYTPLEDLEESEKPEVEANE